MPDSRWKLISICTLCGEGDMAQKLGELIDKISIHALREEGDAADAARLSSISIHAFREEGNHIAPNSPRNAVISIHALREEDDAPVCRHTIAVLDFYPRPPRGGRPAGHCGPRRAIIISIHTLREEGDCAAFCGLGSADVFLSTPSARRATPGSIAPGKQSGRFLSTPSARRATAVSGWATRLLLNFYPRPPRGGRRSLFNSMGGQAQFLSTPSARRATFGYQEAWAEYRIFLSTPSARRATDKVSS